MENKLKIIFYLVLFSFLNITCAFSQSQNFLKGNVIDASTKAPISNCSVFVNSSSRGTTTNTSGDFILQNLPEGKHELIISSIGYQTFVYEYSSAQLPLDLRISLRQKETDLSVITVEPDVQDGWKVWGKTFVDNFIGTTENANDCTIKNVGALHFRFSKKINRLTVIADEPLIIENKALGYSIKYQLEEFYCDFHSHITLYLGYPLFTQMATERKKKEMKWEEHRHEAYAGSIIHFMKSIYYNQLPQQGFQLVKKIRTLNAEKQRVKNLYAAAASTADTFQVQHDGTLKKIDRHAIVSKDSVAYYESVLRKHDFDETYKGVIPDSIVNINDDGTKSLFFTDSVYLVYKNPKDGIPRQSMFYLATPSPVVIYSNGVYSPPQEIVTNGYWGRFEKVANDLPVDYVK